MRLTDPVLNGQRTDGNSLSSTRLGLIPGVRGDGRDLWRKVAFFVLADGVWSVSCLSVNPGTEAINSGSSQLLSVIQLDE
jgi:hypothetical protein